MIYSWKILLHFPWQSGNGLQVRWWAVYHLPMLRFFGMLFTNTIIIGWVFCWKRRRDVLETHRIIQNAEIASVWATCQHLASYRRPSISLAVLCFTPKQVFGLRTAKSQPIWIKVCIHLLLYGVHLWDDLDRDRRVGGSRPNQNDYIFCNTCNAP